MTDTPIVVNPLLQSKRLPGETVRLPSRALTYTTNQVAPEVLEKGELHVYPMATYEEILMKTPDLLFSGQAIVQTFSRCIPQIVNPLELIAKDVDFLLVILRKITYGSTVEIKYDHSCENHKPHTYNIDVRQFLNKIKELDPTTFKERLKYTMPSGESVNIRPYLLADVIAASQRSMENRNAGELSDLEFAQMISSTIIEGLAPALVDVDGVSEQGFIREWLETIPPPWVADLTHHVEQVNKFGLEFQSDVVCKDCKAALTLNVPLNPQSFFTQPSVQASLPQ